MELKLPSALEPFRDKILATRRTFVSIKAQPVISPLPSTASCIGGTPWLPSADLWPRSADGKPFRFLAQINFAEVPALDKFPTEGLLQFYIGDNDLYGMDFDDGAAGTGHRVLYFPAAQLSEPGTPVDTSTFGFSEYTPLGDYACSMSFSLSEEVVSMQDIACETLFDDTFWEPIGDSKWDVIDAYNTDHTSTGHKIGGYAFFTQSDPRPDAVEFNTLLFQLDSDHKADIMWGDMGVGNFFINDAALAALDFSKVLYNYDCH